MTERAVTTWLPAADGDGDLLALLPAGYDDLRALYASLWESGIDPCTLELCRIRMATLIRSSADAEARDPRAAAAGLDERAVAALPSWPSSPLFTEAQRAALSFAEQYVIDPNGFTDEAAAGMHEHFTPPELASLTIAVACFDALTRIRTLITVDANRTELPTRDATVRIDL